MDIPFPHLFIIQGLELTRDIYTGVITLEAYADSEDVELPKIFGNRPSDLRKFSLGSSWNLGLYSLAAQYIPETYAPFSPRIARNTYAGPVS